MSSGRTHQFSPDGCLRSEANADVQSVDAGSLECHCEVTMKECLACLISPVRECRICGWKMCIRCHYIAEKKYGTIFTVEPLHNEMSNHKLSPTREEIICYN